MLIGEPVAFCSACRPVYCCAHWLSVGSLKLYSVVVVLPPPPPPPWCPCCRSNSWSCWCKRPRSGRTRPARSPAVCFVSSWNSLSCFAGRESFRPKTIEKSRCQPIFWDCVATRVHTSNESVRALTLGNDVAVRFATQPVRVAAVELVGGVVAVEVRAHRVAVQCLEAHPHEVDRAEAGVGNEHDGVGREGVDQRTRCRRRPRAGSARRRLSRRARASPAGIDAVVSVARSATVNGGRPSASAAIGGAMARGSRRCAGHTTVGVFAGRGGRDVGVGASCRSACERLHGLARHDAEAGGAQRACETAVT